MNDEIIDRILADEDELVPSSGFAASVMDRIRDEAAVPPPIPFPWRRIVPGIVLGSDGLGWGAVELTRLAIAAAHHPQPVAVHIASAILQPMQDIGWIALSLGIALVAWLGSRRLAGTSRLL